MTLASPPHAHRIITTSPYHPPWRLTANTPCWKFEAESCTAFRAASTHAVEPDRRRLLDLSNSCLFGLSGEQLTLEPARKSGDFPLRVLASLLRGRPTSTKADPDIQGVGYPRTRTVIPFADHLLAVALNAEPTVLPVASGIWRVVFIDLTQGFIWAALTGLPGAAKVLMDLGISNISTITYLVQSGPRSLAPYARTSFGSPTGYLSPLSTAAWLLNVPMVSLLLSPPEIDVEAGAPLLQAVHTTVAGPRCSQL